MTPSPSSASLPARRVFAFNGDADGIVSQHLLTLLEGAPDARFTGLKRDLCLLRHLPDAPSGTRGQHVFACDINLRDNRDDLLRLLQNPATEIFWYDHHEPGDIPDHPRLVTRIVTGRGTCTGLIVHADLLRRGHRIDPCWAAMAAFGDNLPEAARALLAPLELDADAVEALREAGELLNYNAYGEDAEDVLFAPLDVAVRMEPFADAQTFIRGSGLIEPLRTQLREDEEKMGGLVPDQSRGGAALYVLPGEAFARRLGSTFANRAALADPGRAVAVLHPLRDGSFQASIRAPRGRPGAAAASTLAEEFPSGGGRALAAGVNRLSPAEVDRFTRRFFDTYG